MREMYIIVCAAGWAWTLFAFAYLGWRHFRATDEKG
jgi:hypothetical protein